MSNETRYGMISDIHADPRIIVPTLEVLKKEGAQRLLVNGDIGGRMDSLEESQQYTAFILDKIVGSGLDAYVQPGSHETVEGFHPVLNHFAQKYSNMKNVFDNRRVEQEDHDLVFIPGSDFLCGGQYQIGYSDEMETGLYDTKNGPMFFENMADLKSHVRDPKNTIVICHVPRRFDNLETAVDMAEFGVATLDFPFQGDLVKRGSVFPRPAAEKIAGAGYPVALKNENRGNQDLGRVYDEVGITKAVTGHFHESSHRANDRKGNAVPENTQVKELFWNSGHLDVGFTGILTVRGSDVSYRNINLKKHLS